MTGGNTIRILSMLAATNLLCCLTVMAGEYVCTSACSVYPVGGNRAVAEVKEGKQVHGEPDATGRWLIMNGKRRPYGVDLSHWGAPVGGSGVGPRHLIDNQMDAPISHSMHLNHLPLKNLPWSDPVPHSVPTPSPPFPRRS